MISYLRGALISLIVPLVLLGAWFWLHSAKGADNSFIADPLEVWTKAKAVRGELLANAWLSLLRVFIGVAAGASLGMSAGFALGRWTFWRTLFGPTLNALTAIPILVLIPFFLIAFGFGELFRVAVVAATAFLLVYQQAYAAVLDMSPAYFEVASIYEKTEWQIVLKLLLPGTLPDVVRAIRFSFLFAWLAVALAEKAVAEWPRGGLGYQILRAREQGHYPELFAAVIVLGALAWALDAVLARAQKRVSHWQDGPEER